MTKTWSDFFKESMDSCGLPVPASLYSSAATALGVISGLLSALKTVATSKDALTVAGLVSAARTVPLLQAVQVATLSELAAIAGGALAAGYVGALLGAAIYATEKTYFGWTDRLIDWATATNDFASLDLTARSLGVAATYRSKTMPEAMPGEVTRLAINQATGRYPTEAQAGWPTSRVVV